MLTSSHNSSEMSRPGIRLSFFDKRFLASEFDRLDMPRTLKMSQETYFDAKQEFDEKSEKVLEKMKEIERLLAAGEAKPDGKLLENKEKALEAIAALPHVKACSSTQLEDHIDKLKALHRIQKSIEQPHAELYADLGIDVGHILLTIEYLLQYHNVFKTILRKANKERKKNVVSALSSMVNDVELGKVGQMLSTIQRHYSANRPEEPRSNEYSKKAESYFKIYSKLTSPQHD